MIVDELLDKVAATFLFMTFPLVMAGGMALANVSPEATTQAINVAKLSLLAGFACFLIGVFFVLSILFIPRSILNAEVRTPSISVDW